MRITQLIIMTTAALLLSTSALAGDLSVDNLTVSKDAAVYGALNIQSTTASTNGAASATGGVITTNGGYRIHTFTNSGTFMVSSGSLTCDVLVVAGGGGGGGGYNGAGGGAGGLVFTSSYNVAVGNHDVIVGDGGIGGLSWSVLTNGGMGETSSFDSLVAYGGGGGGGYGLPHGENGGSGGGASSPDQGDNSPGTGEEGQGHDGGTFYAGYGYGAGGGGGSGDVGGNGTTSKGGDGGVGLDMSSYFGVGIGENGFFAGGGGGSIYSGNIGLGGDGGGGGGGDSGSNVPFDGTPNTGGGGGGGERGGGLQVGGSGGSGIVIVRYQITSASSSNNVSTILTISSNGINQAGTSGTNVFMSKVGIGDGNPAEKLHVAGNLRVDGTNIVSAMTLGNETRTNWPNVAVGALIASNNLSDVTDKAAARANLGLGSAATNEAGVFLTPTSDGSQLTNITASQVGALSTNAGALIAANNLSDVANAGTSRANLGLGTAATNDTSAFLSTTGGEVNGDISLVSPAGDIPMGSYTNK